MYPLFADAGFHAVAVEMFPTSQSSWDWGRHRFCPPVKHCVYLLVSHVITLVMVVSEINRDVWKQCAAAWATTSHVFHHYSQWLGIKHCGKKKEEVCKFLSACSSGSSANGSIRWWMRVIHASLFIHLVNSASQEINWDQGAVAPTQPLSTCVH